MVLKSRRRPGIWWDWKSWVQIMSLMRANSSVKWNKCEINASLGTHLHLYPRLTHRSKISFLVASAANQTRSGKIIQNSKLARIKKRFINSLMLLFLLCFFSIFLIQIIQRINWEFFNEIISTNQLALQNLSKIGNYKITQFYGLKVFSHRK